MFLGVDVGAERFHVAGLDERFRIEGAWLFEARELSEVVALARGSRSVGIDAPAETSSLAHAGDPSLAPKFRVARCAEIALGREYGSWVPWVAPAERPETGWIATGLHLYDALAAAGVDTFEVFPYAGFRALARGAKLARKQTAAGMRARIDLLQQAGVEDCHLAGWSHDSLDALLGALTALHRALGRAVRVGCGHDGSAIWLPTA